MWALTFLFRSYYDPSLVCHVFSVLFCIRVSSKKLAAKKGLVLQEWKVKICFRKWKYLAEHANAELFFCCLFFLSSFHLLYACHLHFLSFLHLLFGMKTAEAGMAEGWLNCFLLIARDGKEACEDGDDRTFICYYFRINLFLSPYTSCTTREYSLFHCSGFFIACGIWLGCIIQHL